METLKLTPDLLIGAYTQGIFPMDVDGAIEWFSPDPRAIIPLQKFHAPKNLRQKWRNGSFEIHIDSSFNEVIRNCGERNEGTWISQEIMEAYSRLHRLGLAHSVETWMDNELAGGLYGVSLGGAFFGESMFHRRTDASKLALLGLVKRMRQRGFKLLDVQFWTAHLARFGTIEIPRTEYMTRLAEALDVETSFVD
jgi:leucyl/phenylalanyl-tRNA---protein transferase